MANFPVGFTGWLAAPGKPFPGPVFLPYDDRSLVIIGANSYGKTRLLSALVDPATPRVYSRLPTRLAPYLATARLRVESGAAAEGTTDIEALFREGESARATGDEERWWGGHLRIPELRWIVTWLGDDVPATLSAVAANDEASRPAVVIRASPRHVADTLVRWTMPDAQETASLAQSTEDGFRSWAGDVLVTCGGSYRISANPLIAVGASEEDSVSLLALATRFASEVAIRARARLALLIGLTVQLRCLPAERFSWQLKVDDAWIPLEWASRAVSRWSALTARETIRELNQYTAYAAAADASANFSDILRGVLDSALLPPGAPRPFASQASWVALDEPEVHLFASESCRLGEVLAGHSQAGRMVVVTHSLELAAQFVGNADFVMFDGPGRFTVGHPSDGLTSLLQRLTRSGPGILAGTRVLYVEGDWDIELIGLLYGDLLARHNVLLNPMHGVKGASLAASSVWQRMMATPFGVMFDSLSADDVAAKWAKFYETVAAGGRGRALHALRQQIKAARGRPHEEIELLRLFHAVIDGGLEDRLQLVMHGLSDIFQVMHPSVFGLAYANWRDAGFDGTQSFKGFLHARANVDLKDGHLCRQRVKAFAAAGHPVDAESERALRDALQSFIAPAELADKPLA